LDRYIGIVSPGIFILNVAGVIKKDVASALFCYSFRNFIASAVEHLMEAIYKPKFSYATRVNDSV
jgi:hypothetical protein